MLKKVNNNISVVIHTFNEEKNIRNCLETVKWADEIILVDMYSKDKTVDIAKEYTDKIYFFKNVGYADPARQFSLEKTTNKWVLSVDADEIVPLSLKKCLIKIKDDDAADVVYIPHKNYFAGILIKGLGWGPLQSLHPRFFKKEFFSFSGEIHNFSKIKEGARIHKIENPEDGFVHFSYKDVEHFIEKLNRYTTIEAKKLFEAGEDIKLRHMAMRVLSEFRWRYLNHKGYKDGFMGFSISLLMGMYRLVTYTKLKLMRMYNSPNTRGKIEEKYQKIADEIITEYEV
ncbi:glycosyltransferase family 2 protein [Methanobacterium paludis]|uniref:Glycosyl transferase family 2 n=1 Tax=Methanobacterium paludis (strain DSM 25820 / JCM 18151 / SWAN1) TaxID=868131 RepID=F6D2M6_METPW|nr:glycosyltransferase family 2 protein [Methanobacterium paludis]AEG17960.1 glycosyl transferase family 2 [Methanobacterium paludis]